MAFIKSEPSVGFVWQRKHGLFVSGRGKSISKEIHLFTKACWSCVKKAFWWMEQRVKSWGLQRERVEAGETVVRL